MTSWPSFLGLGGHGRVAPLDPPVQQLILHCCSARLFNCIRTYSYMYELVYICVRTESKRSRPPADGGRTTVNEMVRSVSFFATPF